MELIGDLGKSDFESFWKVISTKIKVFLVG
jgi:hypothetical protein